MTESSGQETEELKRVLEAQEARQRRLAGLSRLKCFRYLPAAMSNQVSLTVINTETERFELVR